MPLFGRTLDVVGGFDDGNIDILQHRSSMDFDHPPKLFDEMTEREEIERDREREREEDLEFAVEVGKADFGGVFEGTVGLSPGLEGAHVSPFPLLMPLRTLFSRLRTTRIVRPFLLFLLTLLLLLLLLCSSLLYSFESRSIDRDRVDEGE